MSNGPPGANRPIQSQRAVFTSISLRAEPEATSPEARKIVVPYTPDTGLRLFGNPRPHQAAVKSGGFRLSNRPQCWYLPDSRGRAPDSRLVETSLSNWSCVGSTWPQHR